MFLSMFKLISLFFMACGLAYFSYKIWGNSLLHKLLVIFLDILALGSFIAQLYVNVLFMALVSLSIFGLLMLALDLDDDELDGELEEF